MGTRRPQLCDSSTSSSLPVFGTQGQFLPRSCMTHRRGWRAMTTSVWGKMTAGRGRICGNLHRKDLLKPLDSVSNFWLTDARPPFSLGWDAARIRICGRGVYGQDDGNVVLFLQYPHGITWALWHGGRVDGLILQRICR